MQWITDKEFFRIRFRAYYITMALGAFILGQGIDAHRYRAQQGAATHEQQESSLHERDRQFAREHNAFLDALERGNPYLAAPYDDRKLANELLSLRRAQTPAEREAVVTHLYGQEFLAQHSFDTALEHAIKSDGLTFSHRLRVILNYRFDHTVTRRLFVNERQIEAALDWSEGRTSARYETSPRAARVTQNAHRRSNPWEIRHLLFGLWSASIIASLWFQMSKEAKHKKWALPRGLAGWLFILLFLPSFVISWSGLGLVKLTKLLVTIDFPKLFRRQAPGEKMEAWIAKLYEKQSAALTALADRIAATNDSPSKKAALKQLEKLKARLTSLTARERERIRVLTDEPSESDVSDELKRLDEELGALEESDAAARGHS